jgi:hypothetical protein
MKKDLKKNLILEKLKDDEHYYGEFGRQFLSNSNIQTLLTNPLALREEQQPNINFLVGGYFHTAILEPDKLKKYKIVQSSTRNTNIYKELSGGEMCLLQHEVDQLEVMIDKVLSNEVCKGLIRSDNVDYEVPGVSEICGEMWKGKADILNHSEKLIIDLKTTSNILDFKYSAKKYNYDSQAYIYKHLFGYDLVFMAIDKNTHQIGIYDCSEEFLQRGKDKVEKAVEAYNLFYNNPDFKPENYFINLTL